MKCFDQSQRHTGNAQKGFTLLEVLVAVAIMAVIGVVVLQAFDSVSAATRNNNERTIAANICTDFLEAIKEMEFAEDYPDAGDGISIPPDYEIMLNITFTEDGENWVSTYSGQTLQKIVVAVYREGKPVFSICTLRAKR